MRKVILGLFVSGLLLIATGCARGLAYANLSGSTLHDVTVSWDGFEMKRMYFGGGVFGVRGGFPDKFNFSWRDSRTGKIKTIELDTPKQAQGYPWGGMKILVHPDGVIEVMHARGGKKVKNHGYKIKIAEQW